MLAKNIGALVQVKENLLMGKKNLWRAKTINKPLDDGKLLKLFLQKMIEVRFIETVEQIETNWNDKVYDVNTADPEEAYDKMISKIPKKDYLIGFALRGSRPFDWEIRISFGIGSMLFFFFEDTLIKTQNKQVELLKHFKEIHNADNTEFAFIHPKAHYHYLEDDLYRSPITIQSMFEGVYWANFIGPGHLESFDQQKIMAMNAYKTEWFKNNTCLFLQGIEDISNVHKKTVEKELMRLTKLFDQARVKGSKWYED